MDFNGTVTITDGPGKDTTLTVETEYPHTITVYGPDVDSAMTSDPTAAAPATIAY